MKNSISLIVIIASTLIAGCAPTTFVKTVDASWNTIEVREDLTNDDAWNATVDLIARKFDIEVLSKEDGYLRTGWLHSWTGKLTDSYKVRAIVKFTPDKRKLEIKSEAHYYAKGFMGVGQGWQMGTDERLISTLRTDVMGKIGRVTR